MVPVHSSKSKGKKTYFFSIINDCIYRMLMNILDIASTDFHGNHTIHYHINMP